MTRIGLRVGIATAIAGAVTALSVASIHDHRLTLADVDTTPVVVQSTHPVPYKPVPRGETSTNRGGVRPTLNPSVTRALATQKTTPAKRHPIPSAPADVRISFYDSCPTHPQRCIDAGELTFYGGRILAGHNYMGYQWLSRVPVGDTVRVVSGPMAGTYRVYGHMALSRQGGAMPHFPGSPVLVLQSCEGSGTGFSLLHRV